MCWVRAPAATGVQGFSHQTDLSTAPTGVGVHGVGRAVGVLAQAADSGIALKAIAPSGGTAIDAAGLVRVAGHIDAAGTITGRGGQIGILAQSDEGGTALKAVAPEDGTAIEATGPVMVNGPATAATFSGSGAGLTGLDADEITTGTLAPERLPAAAARREAFNFFRNINVFQSTTRFMGRIVASSAGVAEIESGQDHVDVTLPAAVGLSAASAILLTPQESVGSLTYHARRLSSSQFRIGLSDEAPRTIRFGYAVFN